MEETTTNNGLDLSAIPAEMRQAIEAMMRQVAEKAAASALANANVIDLDNLPADDKALSVAAKRMLAARAARRAKEQELLQAHWNGAQKIAKGAAVAIRKHFPGCERIQIRVDNIGCVSISIKTATGTRLSFGGEEEETENS